MKGNNMKITIYQPKNPTFRIDPDQVAYDKNNYNEVYEMSLTKEQEQQSHEDIDVLLEEIFRIFNVYMPKDFEGHSLSVGDIVELDDGYTSICDVFGWREINWTK